MKDIPVMTVVETKKGVLTTEFWMHLLTSGAGMALAFMPNNPYVQALGMVIAAGTTAHWTISRGKLKAMALNAGYMAFKAAMDTYNNTDENGNPLNTTTVTTVETKDSTVPNLPIPSPSLPEAGSSVVSETSSVTQSVQH